MKKFIFLALLLSQACRTDPSPALSPEAQLASTLETASSALVQLTAVTAEHTASCTGFHMGAGIIITAQHCTEDALEIHTKIAERDVPLIVLATDSRQDVALLMGDLPDYPVLQVSPTPPVLMEQLFFLGLSKAQGGAVLVDPVRMTLFESIGDNNTIMTTEGLYPGMSGGPLVNIRGEVVGVARGVTTLPMIQIPTSPPRHYHRDFGNASPITDALALADMLIEEADAGE